MSETDGIVPDADDGARVVSELMALPITGELTPRLADITVQNLERAIVDPSVRGVLALINSPGGNSGATERICGAIARARAAGVVVASWCSATAASGAFQVWASCEPAFAGSSGWFGGVGVSRYLCCRGQLAFFTTARGKSPRGPHKLPHLRDVALSEEEARWIQEDLAQSHEAFVGSIASARGVDRSVVETVFADGRSIDARDALRYGLATAIRDFDQARLHLLVTISNNGSNARGSIGGEAKGRSPFSEPDHPVERSRA